MFLPYNQYTPIVNTRTAVLPRVHYGFFPSQYGMMCALYFEKQICGLTFVSDQFVEASAEEHIEYVKELLKGYVNSQTHFFTNDNITLEDWISAQKEFKLLLLGTPFQLMVWQQLIRIPSDLTMSYTALAESLNRPKSVRAVASAVAANRIALFIPCHRIVNKDLSIGDYRWGKSLKAKILSAEGFHAYQEFPEDYQPLF